MKFPRYRYADMVRLQHRLVTEQFGLTRLRLVMGTSMGEMHAWMWGYMFPSFADGLVPLARNPVAIAGRNRVWRKLLVDAIVTDPTWQDGNYTTPPRGRHLARRSDRSAPEDDRRQRHDRPLPRLRRLRSVSAAGRGHGAAARHQLRR